MTTAELQEAIMERGGIINAHGMSKRWGLGKSTVSGMTKRKDFPDPVSHLGESPVWLYHDVLSWRLDMELKSNRANTKKVQK